MSEEKQQDDNKPDNADLPKTTPGGATVVRTIGRDFRVEGNNVDGYIGVDPEYRTYAGVADKPFTTDADVEALLRSGQLTDVEAMTMSNAAMSTPPTRVEEDDKASDDEDEADEGPEEPDRLVEAPEPESQPAQVPVKSTPAKAAPAKAASAPAK